MRIATYNIWVSETNFNRRLNLLAKVLNQARADFVALQEVRDKEVVNFLASSCGFPCALWKKYHDCNEGLAVLSNFPIIFHLTNWEGAGDTNNSFVLRTVVDYPGMQIGFTNLHLDSESAVNREIGIVNAVKMLKAYPYSAYEILLGDFNAGPDSSIHRYLTGDQSLHGNATDWVDLAETYAYISGTQPKPTLDLAHNPRWDGENIILAPQRLDWIMLEYPSKAPKLNFLGIIGDQREAGITASDHYGVLCDLEFAPAEC